MGGEGGTTYRGGVGPHLPPGEDHIYLQKELFYTKIELFYTQKVAVFDQNRAILHPKVAVF